MSHGRFTTPTARALVFSQRQRQQLLVLTLLCVTMAEGEGDSGDWLFDYMMSVFKAPTWEVPIMTFIDDNCIVFDSEEENKFAYTELHEVRGIVRCHAPAWCPTVPRGRWHAPGAARAHMARARVLDRRRTRSNSARWSSHCWSST